MKRSLKKGLWGAVSAAAMLAVASPVAEASEPFSLRILHTNDIHAQIDHLDKTSYFINEQRAEVEHALYVDAGDIFSGNPVVDLVQGESIIAILNAMELDLMTLGNHEFDYGQEALAARRAQSNFDWLSANTVIDRNESELEDFTSHQVYNFDGVKVGFLGLTQAPPATAPAGLTGLSFRSYADTIKEYEYLRDEVDVMIALNHIGLADDERVALATGMFDLIIGGHSHTALNEAKWVNGTPIVQSGSHNKNVGVVDLTYDRDTADVTIDSRLQPVAELDDANVNPEVTAMIEQYNAANQERLGHIIGQTVNELNRDERWAGDVSIGNMITDALRDFTGADVAITNNGGIRASIAAGEITLGDIYTVDPFGNRLTTVELSGATLKEIVAYSFHRSLNDYGPQNDIQTSGMTFTIYTDEDGLYADADLFIGGQPVDMDKRYTLSTNNFMVTGGDGYDFSDATIINEDEAAVTDALIAYIEAAGELDYAETEGRIQIKPLSERENDKSDLENGHSEGEGDPDSNGKKPGANDPNGGNGPNGNHKQPPHQSKKKDSVHDNKKPSDDKKKDTKDLPSTGQEQTSLWLIGAVIGGGALLLLLGRKRNGNASNN